MVNTPKSPQCAKLDNASGLQCEQPGAHCPVLLVYAPNGHAVNVPVRVQLPLAICHVHRESSILESFLCDEGWQQISDAMDKAGLVRPDRQRTQLAWETLSMVPCVHEPAIKTAVHYSRNNLCKSCGRLIKMESATVADPQVDAPVWEIDLERENLQ